MKRIAGFGTTLLLIFTLLLGLAWATAPDPEYNPASFEDAPLVAEIAPLDQAVTLAQFRNDENEIRTMLILDQSGETVSGTDLVEIGGSISENPFSALASVTNLPRSQEEASLLPQISLPIAQLLPAGSSGERHIGTGTNFPEHAAEANSESVFQFPKFGPATSARTQVRSRPGILLDYEIELCVRFDRDIASAADFDAARKGFFLCGDFTNRNALVELADPDNLDSGFGFSDAKSGPDYFPSGPFLVIPDDWSGFVNELRMTTTVNDAPRRDARGSEMTMDFRELALKALDDMSEQRFQYKDQFEYLAPEGKIDADMTLMSGTSEGVIFTAPSRGDIIEGLVDYFLAGGPISETSPIDAIKARFIRNELQSGHFLQVGDEVHYRSSRLGDIIIEVVE